ncbi:pentapeptide repeat-containing protein [Actinomadura yumaensis]|uniref:pentapeptide repeat-containing protein n=1 Tax=Actinomadura TaxID=1988 RepID=UPI0035CD1215
MLFGGANLQGANLSDAILQGADLQGAKASEFTRWPIGFSPEDAGVVIVPT